jgi:OPA family glycerol-3-phosphate transporter-like MFS transporter
MSRKKIDSFWFICVSAWLVYILVYFGRINLSIVIPWLQDECGYSKTSLGLLASGFFIAYGGGQFINGVLGDRFNARYFVSIGLVTAGICNICFSVITVFPVMFVCWTLNGYFQSMLWGPLLRAISNSVPPQKQSRAISLMATSPIIGYLLSYTLIGKLAISLGWRSAFFVPGILLPAAAALWFWGSRARRQGEEKIPQGSSTVLSILAPLSRGLLSVQPPPASAGSAYSAG